MTFERIGGEAVARAALDDFFARAGRDDLLDHLLGAPDQAGPRAFLEAALDLGADDETRLIPALAWLGDAGPEDEDLDHMIGHLALALEAQGVAEAVIADIADRAEGLRDAALGVWPDDDEEDEDEEEEVAA
ncbi:MAG: hypothetical protein J7521_21655 [Caulobacter sp.]|nr:hypothetical protein [Caulobacter sp.]